MPGSSDAVRIDNKPAISSAVTITSGQNAGTVTLDSGDTITITSGSLNIYGGSFVNNGTTTLGNYSNLVGAADLSITGTGSIVLNDVGAGGAYLYANGGTTLTLGSGQVARGTGYIGYNSGLIVNNGTINANVSNGGLNLDAQGGSGGIAGGLGTGNLAGLLNTGLLEATNGGTFAFGQGRYENQGSGSILASGAGSTIALGSDVAIIGGTLNTSSGGTINAVSSGTQYLQDVTLGSSAMLKVASDVVRINNTLTNNGTITLGNYSNLVGNSATSTINGGTITMADVGAGGAYLYTESGTAMTLTAGTIVQGTGYVGYNSGLLTNAGTINANVSNGGLNVDAQGGSGGVAGGLGTGNLAAFLNTGLLEATNGGTLTFGQGRYENQGSGSILASGAGSTIALGSDVAIIGGTMSTNTGGVINAVSSGTQYLQDVTLGAGTALSIASDTVRINNTLTNNGTITVGNYGNLVGNTATSTIDGTGTITLNDTGAGPAYLYNENGTKMTIGSGQTVQGTGYVGGNVGVLTNNGTIIATAGGIGLNLDAQGGSGGINAGDGVGTGGISAFLNNALIEATGGGSLNFTQGLYENGVNGQMLAVGSGSQIVLRSDVRILNGTIGASGGATVNAIGNGTQYLQDVTLANGTPLNIASDSVRIYGTLTNNGTITVGNYGNLIGNTVTSTIDGTGTITLNDTGAGPAYLYNENGTKMTIGSGQTVQGTGYVGGNVGVLTNNGTIIATAGGIGLNLDAQGGSGGINAGDGVGTGGISAFLNNALIEATGGGSLNFTQGLYENGVNGQMLAVGSGSQIVLRSDVRILNGTIGASGGGTVNAVGNGTQYLQDVTLANGTPFAISSDTVRIDGTLTNNGTITIGSYGSLIGNSTTPTISGTGTIVLNDVGAGPVYLYDENGTKMTIGNGQTVRGSGNIGANVGAIINQGNILADGSITIDAQGGSGGIGNTAGVGTGGAAFFNDAGGQVQANNGGATLTLVQGLYEQAAGASFSVGAGSTFNMTADSNLLNLKSAGVLDKGLYFAFTNGTMTLRSDQASSIVQIGTNHPGTDTTVYLSGPNSVIQITPSNGSAVTTIDQSLTTIAQSGQLILANGRTFTGQSGFTNAGTLTLAGGTYAEAGSLVNTATGTVIGNGTVSAPITNSGAVIADGGTLNAQAITGTTGTIQSNAGAALSLAGASGPSTAGFLTNNGALALGANSVTVTSDYQNANFGSGSAFDRRANVTGTGLILAASANMVLSGPGLSGNTLNVGNVRLGNSSSTTLTITNTGTLTTLRGAVESPPTNTVNISSSNFVVGPNGGNTAVTLSYTGNTAGSLAGQTVTVATNFDNVADQTLNIQGAAYNPAAASLTPNPITLGATRVGGTLSGTVTIANTAPNGPYSEKLAVTGTSGSGGASGTAPGGLIAPGSNAGSTVALNTATSGNKSGTVTYQLATDGTGTSGLAQAALPSQSVTVNGKVYDLAVAQLATNSVTFATVRQGSTAPTATVGVTNGANGALTDTLNTSVGSLPAGVTGSAPGPLAGGQSGALNFSENTATAGNFSGSGQIGFTSTDPDLAPVTLASQNITFAGIVTQTAIAQIVKDAGAGLFAGSGTSYSLDLGTITAGMGSLSTDLGVFNAIPSSSYSETLGGIFSASGGTGYAFAGNTFAGLAGSGTNTGNLLTFTYSGLGDGTYTNTLTFSGYSRYAGLSDLSLSPITVNVTARVTGSGTTNPPAPGAVPEPASWAMMVAGFGAIGATLRRRKAVVRAA